MKEILRLKADNLANSYREKYIRHHGELYTDFTSHDYTDHLVKLSHFNSLVYRNPLNDRAKSIVDEYYKKNNDGEFTKIMTEYLLELAGSAEEASRRGDTLMIYQSVRPIVQDIAYRMFIEEGVSSILNHPDLNSWS